MGHEAAVAPQPGEGSLDHPAPPDQFEAAVTVRALDDLEAHPLLSQIPGELVSLVAAIGEDMFDEGEQAARLFDQFCGAVPVLHAGWDGLDAKQQAYRIGKRVALDPLDFFACVIANRIPVAPPFSVAFTAWVSMMAAVGDASRPPASRHAMSRA